MCEPSHVTINTYIVRRGVYRVTVWAGDADNLHGKIETYLVKGKTKLRSKLKSLNTLYAKEIQAHKKTAG